MEAVLRAFPRDHHHQTTLAPNKQNRIKTQKRRNNIIRSNNNEFIYSNSNNPSASGILNPPHSLPPSSFSSSSKSYHQRQNHHHFHQPPLLPLPTTTVSKIHHHHPLQSPKNKTATRNISFITPKKSSKPAIMTGNNKNDTGVFLGSVSFNVVSPPPSSLPMPRFCVRSKLISCCNGKTHEGGDAGATHNLH